MLQAWKVDIVLDVCKPKMVIQDELPTQAICLQARHVLGQYVGGEP